jgi:hypothetical protein
MIAQEACRKGVTIMVEDGPNVTKAQKYADEVSSMLVPDILVSWATYLLVEGDLYVQAVVESAKKKLVEATMMPAASMQRLTDDADNFIDVQRAFAQVDVLSNEDVAFFPLTLMYHQRWAHRQGNRYGMPSFISVRRHLRRLDLMEEAKSIDRMVRAPMQLLFNIGTEKFPGNQTSINDFKAANGMVQGQEAVWNPQLISKNYFGNGLTSVDRIEGSQNVDHIEDLKYFLDQVVNTGLPTPGAISGLQGGDINRDVMQDLRDEYNKRVENVEDAIRNVVRWLVELVLMLNDVYPKDYTMNIQFSNSTTEKPKELIERVVTAKNEGLISHKRAIQLTADVHGVDDVDAEHKQVEGDREDAFNKDLALKTARGGVPPASDKSTPKTDSFLPRTNGHHKTPIIEQEALDALYHRR